MCRYERAKKASREHYHANQPRLREANKKWCRDNSERRNKAQRDWKAMSPLFRERMERNKTKRRKANEKVKICEHCREEYRTTRASQRFCSEEHYKAWRRESGKTRQAWALWKKVNSKRRDSYIKRYYLANRERIIAKSQEWIRLNPHKQRAHMKVSSAIRSGKLVRPTSCETCNRDCKPVTHHDDYSKPFCIRWMCGSCQKRLSLSLSKTKV